MRSILNKLDTNPHIQIPDAFKQNPKRKSFLFGLTIFTIISFSILILLNYDPSNPNAEKDLTELHERYTKGEKLDKKDFALYCLLLEKVWKNIYRTIIGIGTILIQSQNETAIWICAERQWESPARSLILK